MYSERVRRNLNVNSTVRPKIPIPQNSKTFGLNIVSSATFIDRGIVEEIFEIGVTVEIMGERGKGRESSVKRFGAGTEGGCCSVLENIAGITQSRKNRMKRKKREYRMHGHAHHDY